jgi:hypothetical protein
MSDHIPVAVSALIVMALVIVIGRRFNLSSRYERKPRELNSWNSLDKGIDPTEDQKL